MGEAITASRDAGGRGPGLPGHGGSQRRAATDRPQKQRVLGALLKQSPEKLKKEADARAFRGKLGFSVHFLSFSRGLHCSPAPLRKFCRGKVTSATHGGEKMNTDP
jgi:hypothetical protein